MGEVQLDLPRVVVSICEAVLKSNENEISGRRDARSVYNPPTKKHQQRKQ